MQELKKKKSLYMSFMKNLRSSVIRYGVIAEKFLTFSVSNSKVHRYC